MSGDARREGRQFADWMIRFTVLWSVAQALLVAIVGIGFRIPIGEVVLAWLALFVTGVSIAALMFWARSPVDQPFSRRSPFRLGVATFGMIAMYFVMLLYIATRLTILSVVALEQEWLPSVLAVSVMAGVSTYFAIRKSIASQNQA